MTLTCRTLTELLIEYVDGTLPDEQRMLMDRHMCGCVPCAIYLRTYQDTIRLTHTLPETPLPPEFASRLKAVLDDVRRED